MLEVRVPDEVIQMVRQIPEEEVFPRSVRYLSEQGIPRPERPTVGIEPDLSARAE